VFPGAKGREADRDASSDGFAAVRLGQGAYEDVLVAVHGPADHGGTEAVDAAGGAGRAAVHQRDYISVVRGRHLA